MPLVPGTATDGRRDLHDAAGQAAAGREQGTRATPDLTDETAEQAALAERLGWRVRDRALLEQSMAHRSWCAEHQAQEPNERLEFLGDAVLGLITTDYLYRRYPGLPEGELAKARAAVVNSVSLAGVARDVGLGKALLLGKGEDASGGRSKASILADTMEAVIGAIYLDTGYRATEKVVLRLLVPRLLEAAKGPGEDDYKTRLQELCARNYDQPPVYRVTDHGPDHAKVFEAAVIVAGRARGKGQGRSKKQAEQMAARHAWSALMAEEASEGDFAGGDWAEEGAEEAAATDGVATDGVATDAVATDAVATDAVASSGPPTA